jgi:Tol biopolymer transport system component
MFNGNLTSMGTATAVTVSFEFSFAFGDTRFACDTQTMAANGPFKLYFDGLAPGTYHFRATAVGDGTVYGEDIFFSIVPSVGTGPSIVKNGTATLYGFTGYVNPAQLSYSFIWGTTPGGPYPNYTPQQLVDPRKAFNDQITGLANNTTYFYKAKVDYGSGISYSAESSFSTNSIAPTYKILFEELKQVWVWDAIGGGLTNITPIDDNSHQDMNPCWSPDGTKIAYTWHGGSGKLPAGIYIITSAGIGLGVIDGYNPTFSPDGTKIAYETRTDPGAYNPAIQVSNIDGTGMIKLADGSNPDWSPDGTKIYYSARLFNTTTGLSEIYVMNSNGSNQTRLTNTPAADLQVCTEPAVSPNDSKVVYIRKDLAGSLASYAIYSMNSDGTNNIKLNNLTAANTPHWLPDGTGITVASFIPDDANYGIFVMKADGSNPQLLTYGTHASMSIASPSAQTYSITATAGAGGAISPAGVNMVNQGTNQTFTIAANTGYIISTLTVDGAAVTPAVSTYTFTNVTANHSIAAGFSIASSGTGNVTGTVASTPFSTGWPNEYNVYINITSTTVPGLIVGQQLLCAASTTDFSNLLSVGAALTGTLDHTLGWWVLQSSTVVPPPPPPTPGTGNVTGTVAGMPTASGPPNEYNVYINITSTTVPGLVTGQRVLCAASTMNFPNLLTVGATLTGTLNNSIGWWVLQSSTVVPPPPPPTPGTGSVTGTVAGMPTASGPPNEYNVYLTITSTTVSGLFIGQQVLCAASTMNFPNLLTDGATLTGTLNNSTGWWVLQSSTVVPPPPPPPSATVNTTGTVARMPTATGGVNEYNLYITITSTTVPGLVIGQQVLCAASTMNFPNLLTVGATLTGTLDHSLGWWVLKK